MKATTTTDRIRTILQRGCIYSLAEIKHAAGAKYSYSEIKKALAEIAVTAESNTSGSPLYQLAPKRDEWSDADFSF